MEEIIDCCLPEEYTNLGLVLKCTLFIHNGIIVIITLTKLITEFMCSVNSITRHVTSKQIKWESEWNEPIIV